ncbi:MAG: squalene/phytoene synthase family protein [Candidatus Tectomicrobia bacterium]|nr:squalene/phytoene synthase family protein [Candidatus Tectomicrobia bacterium]HEX2276752.1 phytoene/squalene synthase family protein [Candidatus Tectomicrobia bacterium]
MPRPSLDRLNGILKRVSRSFYLSLRILPQSLRVPIGLAYLFARAADTIADTSLISPGDRLTLLEQFRTLFRRYDATTLATVRAALVGPQHNPAERELLSTLDQCFTVLWACEEGDQARISRLLLTLTQGMIMDLTVFPPERDGRVVALKTGQDLDRYTYYVAGCVGEFWTETHVTHRRALATWDVEVMKGWGVRFGKGLQMTNILRDLAHDLRLGRCYLPLTDLMAHGLTPEQLLEPAAIVRVRPIVQDLLALTREHYRKGWAYTQAIPRREVRMRLACMWPLLIGVRTLDLVARADNLLDPRVTLKIPRPAVYRLLLSSSMRVLSNRGLRRYAQQRAGTACFRGEGTHGMANRDRFHTQPSDGGKRA